MLGNFTECQDIALGKYFFLKSKKIFAKCQAREALDKELFKKKLKNGFAECAPPWHSAKSF